MTTKLPEYPWQVLATDLFELKGDHYLLVSDYFSQYLKVVRLATTTSSSVIRALKMIFSRYGIPEVLRIVTMVHNIHLKSLRSLQSHMDSDTRLAVRSIPKAMDLQSVWYKLLNVY